MAKCTGNLQIRTWSTWASCTLKCRRGKHSLSTRKAMSIISIRISTMISQSFHSKCLTLYLMPNFPSLFKKSSLHHHSSSFPFLSRTTFFPFGQVNWHLVIMFKPSNYYLFLQESLKSLSTSVLFGLNGGSANPLYFQPSQTEKFCSFFESITKCSLSEQGTLCKLAKKRVIMTEAPTILIWYDDWANPKNDWKIFHILERRL